MFNIVLVVFYLCVLWYRITCFCKVIAYLANCKS